MKKTLSMILIMVSTAIHAGNPDTHRACGNVGYTKNRDLNVCMKSGAEAEAVMACAKMGTRDISQVNECITSGANLEKINNCVRTSSDMNNFSSCIKS